MRTKERTKRGKEALHYIIAAYAVFWLMVLVICGGASMLFHAPPLVMRWLSNLCAWSPTIVLFVMYKHLCPGRTVSDFFRKNFEGKIRIGLAGIAAVSIVGIFLLSALVTALWMDVSFTDMFTVGSYPVWLTVILSFLAGPTGEECGWRGYLRYELQERFGFLKGNVVLGLVWALWHAVLWAVDNDFTGGTDLLIYVVANMVVITALNVIMGVVLARENNLFYAVLIHFCFNLPYCFLDAGIEFYAVMTVLYALAAVIAVLLHTKSQSA